LTVTPASAYCADGGARRPREAGLDSTPAPRHDRAAQLARMWLLQGLPSAVLANLAAVAEERRYIAGEVILRQGEPADGVYFLAAGVVDIYAAGADGAQWLNRLNVGECFGEMGVVDGAPRSATAIAVSLAFCYFVPEEPFLDLVEQVPEVTLRLVTLVSRRLRRLNRFTAELPGPPHALPREPDL
jgi:CRP/FNR family cyclic AMP-dependent transcriptional regulator